ncbi:helix-turn-helix transcriptional regulator [Dactylosporangium vinaceum]|uniref:Scr1 family TA system antitoxin-like transcriptional regulator n=1 Tax=Dactylosporangium vinaceum TaxID=53362 RepID=A0ABV5MQL8_9ACTN|nr:helix-turn-helix transcriptional regulator [Dactylosporangium vinaceum]UAB96414.1 helix-turn-helix transcriptional regulator [Dactylosporangium vinaceum]
MPRAKSPTVRRRALGNLLRQYRIEKDLKVSDVAERLMAHPSKISRIESGERSPILRDVRDLCQIYGLTAERTAQLLQLAREAREQGWWQQYDIEGGEYLGLESEALKINNFESSIVPGPLQTADYARTVLRAVRPELTGDQVEQTVEVRMVRQHSITENEEPELWAVLDEAVLHRQVGGPDVMRRQLGFLAEVAGHRHVTVQVIPFAAGAHQAMSSAFAWLEFAEGLPGVVLVEGLVGSLYLEKPADIARYRRAFDRLRAIAISPDDSIRLIEAVSRTI